MLCFLHSLFVSELKFAVLLHSPAVIRLSLNSLQSVICMVLASFDLLISRHRHKFLRVMALRLGTSLAVTVHPADVTTSEESGILELLYRLANS